MEKENQGISLGSIIIVLIVLLVGIGIGYFISSNREENGSGSNAENNQVENNAGSENNSDNSTNDNNNQNGTNNNQNNPQIEYDAELAKIDMREKLKSMGITVLNPNPNYLSTNSTNAFNYNNQTITVEETEKELQLKQGNTLKLSVELMDNSTYTIHVVGNYLMIQVNWNYDKVYIVDSNYQILVDKSVDEMAMPAITEGTIYYGIGACEGTRTDGSVGEVVEVYKFDFKSGVNEKSFNLDHNSGWMC